MTELTTTQHDDADELAIRLDRVKRLCGLGTVTLIEAVCAWLSGADPDVYIAGRAGGRTHNEMVRRPADPDPKGHTVPEPITDAMIDLIEDLHQRMTPRQVAEVWCALASDEMWLYADLVDSGEPHASALDGARGLDIEVLER